MRKLMMIGIGLALFFGACGGSSADPAPGTDSESGDVVDEASDPAETRSSPAAGDSSQDHAEQTELSVPATDDSPVIEPAESDNPDTSVGTQPSPPSAEVSHPDPNVELAMAELVDRIGADASAIVVIGVEEVTWPDGSLGCPEPGMRYSQALVNGTRIILEFDGTTYAYHSGGRRGPFYCQNPSNPVSGDYGDA